MKGKLYGIGTGPGDPELLTIKAINTIRKCHMIAVPETGNGEKTAYTIAVKYIEGKELLNCRFSMEHDMAKRKESRQNAAAAIIKNLDKGKDVGFITLGDPTTYSTYMYVHEIVASEGYETEIIPGITSYAAAAAALGIPLCEGNETLTLAAGHSKDIDEILARPGNKAIMKSGAGLDSVLKKLKENGHGQHTKIIVRATMEGQRIYNSIEEYEKSPEPGYFTVAIVGNREATQNR